MPPCALCGTDQHRKLFCKDGRSYYRCRCGFLFSCANRESGEFSPLRYNETYYETWGIGQGNQSPWYSGKIATFDKWLSKIDRHIPAGGRLLDIGCATGTFLERAQQKGWRVAGVEISLFASTEAKKKFNSAIWNGTLAAAHYSTEAFDVVTVFDVVEHLVDPVSFINEIWRILKPTGILVLTTPNTSSLSCQLLGKHWPQFKPEHCSYFSGVLLSKLLAENRFYPVHRGGAQKMLTLSYVASYFKRYASALFGTLMFFISRTLPQRLQRVPICLPTGEMFVIAERRE